MKYVFCFLALFGLFLGEASARCRSCGRGRIFQRRAVSVRVMMPRASVSVGVGGCAGGQCAR